MRTIPILLEQKLNNQVQKKKEIHDYIFMLNGSISYNIDYEDVVKILNNYQTALLSNYTYLKLLEQDDKVYQIIHKFTEERLKEVNNILSLFINQRINYIVRYISSNFRFSCNGINYKLDGNTFRLYIRTNLDIIEKEYLIIDIQAKSKLDLYQKLYDKEFNESIRSFYKKNIDLLPFVKELANQVKSRNPDWKDIDILELSYNPQYLHFSMHKNFHTAIKVLPVDITEDILLQIFKYCTENYILENGQNSYIVINDIMKKVCIKHGIKFNKKIFIVGFVTTSEFDISRGRFGLLYNYSKNTLYCKRILLEAIVKLDYIYHISHSYISDEIYINDYNYCLLLDKINDKNHKYKIYIVRYLAKKPLFMIVNEHNEKVSLRQKRKLMMSLTYERREELIHFVPKKEFNVMLEISSGDN